jgi:hypothetical protein
MVLRHKKCTDLMRGISFWWCEGRPKRTHNPEGNCQRCLDPFHDDPMTVIDLCQKKMVPGLCAID